MGELRHPYPSVFRDGKTSYGGNQGWSQRKVTQKCGCGVIAAVDLLIYLYQNRPGFQIPELQSLPETGAVPFSDYDKMVDRMRRRYLPLIPHVGLTGITLALGLNLYFWRNRLPMRAGWSIRGSRLWSCMEDMLEQDLPVIFSIGANIPFIWGKQQVRLYVRGKDGVYRSSGSVKAHYVTVTGMDQRWLRVSSWGKEYYIDRKEYIRYVNKYSSYLVSNLVRLTPLKTK